MLIDDIRDGIISYLDSYGSADYITMYEGIAIVKDIAGYILTFLGAMLLVGLPIVISIEVMYINFPTFQSVCDNLYGRFKGKPSKMFGLVIRDARKAVEDSKTDRCGVSPNWIYLEIKLKSIIFAAIVITLVFGPGDTLVAIVYNMVVGILDAL